MAQYNAPGSGSGDSSANSMLAIFVILAIVILAAILILGFGPGHWFGGGGSSTVVNVTTGSSAVPSVLPSPTK
jgi:hypothetical protein